MNIRHVSAAIVLLLTAACTSIEERWETTRAADSVEGYREFLIDYPADATETDVPFRARAEARLAERFSELWIEARAANTIEALTGFLAHYPPEEYALPARETKAQLERLAELEALSRALMESVRAICRRELRFARNEPSIVGPTKAERLEHLAQVRSALEKGADPNALRCAGFRAAGGSTTKRGNMVETLFLGGSLGTIVRAPEGDKSALDLAVGAGDGELVDLLLLHHAR